MKAIRSSVVRAVACVLPDPAIAVLIDRGGGLIFYTALNITWLQDANYAKTSRHDSDGMMDWASAVAWAEGLVYQGCDGWRLPTQRPINGVSFQFDFRNNATADAGYAKTTTDGTDGGWRDMAGNPVSEMGHMFYFNLRNLGFCLPIDALPGGCAEQPGWGLSNTSFTDGLTGATISFQNIQVDLSPAVSAVGYWTGVEVSSWGPDAAWVFFFGLDTPRATVAEQVGQADCIPPANFEPGAQRCV